VASDIKYFMRADQVIAYIKCREGHHGPFPVAKQLADLKQNSVPASPSKPKRPPFSGIDNRGRDMVSRKPLLKYTCSLRI
jgi:hypothetical protein